MEGQEQQPAPAEDSGSAPAVDSPPAGSPATDVHDPVREADEARRRLVELRTQLAERFDRRHWQEYVRLRRAARAS
jgi:hypothetical protein